MEKLIKKVTVRKIFHQNGFRICHKNLERLDQELSKLVKDELEKIMRSAKIRGRKNIEPEHWKWE